MQKTYPLFRLRKKSEPILEMPDAFAVQPSSITFVLITQQGPYTQLFF
jgi:hypothetical protein